MRHTHDDIPLFIAQGGVSNTTARVMGDSFTMDVPLAPSAKGFNVWALEKETNTGSILELEGKLNMTVEGPFSSQSHRQGPIWLYPEMQVGRRPPSLPLHPGGCTPTQTPLPYGDE